MEFLSHIFGVSQNYAKSRVGSEGVTGLKTRGRPPRLDDTCDCNPEYSVKAFDWDWASFHKNILIPNIMHIRSCVQLSDTVDITDRVVYSAILCLMNGRRGPQKPGFVLFSVEDLDF